MAVNEFEYLGKRYTRIRSSSARLHESLSLSALQVDTLTVVVVSEEAPEVIPPPGLPPESFPQRFIVSEGLPLVWESSPLMEITDRSDPLPPPQALNPYNFEEYVYGTPCKYFHNGQLFGAFYVTKIEQVDRIDWKFSCVSAVGLLINSLHYGGIYQGVTASALIREVIGGEVPFEIDPQLDKAKIYGWLPKGTKRDNLQKVLFAANARITKNVTTGDLRFQPFLENELANPITIEPSRYYLTGNKVTKGSPATQAQVTEHSYFASPADVGVKAFSGEARADTFISPKGVSRTGCLVDFKEPLHDLSVSGCTLLESGVNYAIITASANAVVTGKAYTHTERTMFYGDASTTQKSNVVRSSNDHLVSINNSELVSKRLLAYYGSAKKVVCDLLATDSGRPGDVVEFTDPWSNEKHLGYIQEMEVTFSKEIKAKTTLITGYYPPVQEEEQDFTHRVVLTGSGNWTVPSSIPNSTAKIKKVRYALLSGATGGTGGYGGQSGPTGNSTKSWTNTSWITGEVTSKGYVVFFDGTGGTGGAGGAGGRGSRVLQGTLDVTPGQVIAYRCGTGGSGGYGGSGGSSSSSKTNGAAGSTGAEGSATTFGTLSSSAGQFPPTTGWVDVTSGTVYCQQGKSGRAGGTGAGRDMSASIPDQVPRFSSLKFIPATAAVDQAGRSWAGQATKSGTTVGGSEVNIGSNGLQDITYSATSTTAGGATYGLGPGGVAGVNQGTCTAKGTQYTVGATACSGQTPPAPVQAPAETTATRGGTGGYGGGGASAPGAAGKEVDKNGNASSGVRAGSVGAGGRGGAGGVGGPGLIILYY